MRSTTVTISHHSSAAFTLATLALALTASAASAQLRYTVVEIVPPIDPLDSTEPGDIDDTGRVAAFTCDGRCPSNALGFMVDESTYTILEALEGATFSVVTAISDDGFTCGYSGRDIFDARATCWDPTGRATDLGLLDGHVRSMAWDCNARGQIVGESADLGEGARPVLWQNSETRVLVTGSAYGRALGIDASGEMIVGEGWDHADKAWQGVEGFVIIFDSFQRIGTLAGGSFSSLVAINDRGEAVGSADANGVVHAIRYDGTMHSIEPLGHDLHAAFNDVNIDGVAVGFSGARAVVAYDDRLIDLNDRLAVESGAGWVLEEATGINSDGQIIGRGTSPVGAPATFLLTPVRPSHSVSVKR
jgi:uncharacterized membrane protein